MFLLILFEKGMKVFFEENFLRKKNIQYVNL